ncbi:MAG: FtsB family cell division protein [Thermoleophilia bacterium]
MTARAATTRRFAFVTRRRGLWRLGMLAVILIIAAGYISPVMAIYSRSNDIKQEQAEASQLQQKHDSLQVERDRLQTNSYVEEVARRDLGLIRPGEQPYVVRDLGAASSTPAKAPAAPAPKSLLGRVLDDLKSLLP